MVTIFTMIVVAVMLVAGGHGGLAEASPNDVLGSDNVAVASYANRYGTFVLWSSGRITDISGSLVNASNDYTNVMENQLPVRSAGHIVGSKNVAVGVIQNTQATRVLFSDGSVRQPASPRASGVSGGQPRMMWGNIQKQGSGVTAGYANNGSGDWSVGNDSVNVNGAVRVSFHKPFDKQPAVAFTDNGIGATLGGVDCYGFTVKCNRATGTFHFSFIVAGES